MLNVGFYAETFRRQQKKSLRLTAVLKFVVADGRPFETTAGVGFQNLCAVITDGACKPPHPTTLSRQLNDMSANLKQKFIDKLKSGIGDSRPSITFDHWKADNDTNYLVLTVHLSASWKRCYGCYGVMACVVYTADSIRKFDLKSNRTADSIRFKRKKTIRSSLIPRH